MCLASRLGLYLSRYDEAVTVVFMRDHSVRCAGHIGLVIESDCFGELRSFVSSGSVGLTCESGWSHLVIAI